MRRKNRSKWLSSFCHKPDQVNWRSSKICQHFIQTRKYTLINMVELDFMIWVLIATYKTCKSKFAVTLCKCVPCQHMSSLRLSLFYEHILFSSKKKKMEKTWRRSVCFKIRANCGKLENRRTYRRKLQNMLPIKVWRKKYWNLCVDFFPIKSLWKLCVLFSQCFRWFSQCFSDVMPEMCHKSRLRWGENMICIKIFDFMGFLWQTLGLLGL